MLNTISALPEGVRLFVDVSAKGLLALAVAGAINVAVPRFSAARRHMVWLLALLSLIAVPALALVGPTWRVALLPKRTPVPELPQPTAERKPVEPARAEAVAVGTPEIIPFAPVPPGVGSAARSQADLPTGELTLSLAPASKSARPVASPLPPGRPEISLVWPWLVGVWAAGLACALAGPLVGLVLTTRAARAARSNRARPRGSRDAGQLPRLLAEVRAEMGVRRHVPLAFAGPGAVPMALGLFRPLLLLPDEAATWPERRARSVLRHELAHVLRRDCLTHFLARVACALHWFNPLAWFALRQLRGLQERACDDRVLACGAKASDYAEDLLAVATSRPRTGGRSRWRLRDLAWPTVGLAMARKGNPSTLRARLSALLDPRRGRRPAGAAARVAAALALLALPPFSALRVARTADAAKHDPRSKAAPTKPAPNHSATRGMRTP